MAALAAVVAVLCVASVCAENCIWIETITMGETETFDLEKPWTNFDCPSGVIRYTVKSANGNTARFPSQYSPTLQFSPSSSLTFSGSSAYTRVDIRVQCNGLVDLCSNAQVYFVVRPAPTTPEPTSTEPTSTEEPTSTQEPTNTTYTPTETTTPIPVGPPVCTAPETIYPWVGASATIASMDHVTNCASPTVEIVSVEPATASALFTTQSAASSGNPVIVFDSKGTNTAEGVFTVSYRVLCGTTNPSTVNQCTLAQTVVAKKRVTDTPEPETPACSIESAFRTSFDEVFMDTLEVTAGDEALCPLAVDIPRHYVFRSTSVPAHNPSDFALATDGTFVYHAPSGPTVGLDGFSFAVAYARGASAVAGEVTFPLCVSTVSIRVTAPPPTTTTTTSTEEPTTTTEAPAGDSVCTGDFHYTYALTAAGAVTPKLASLTARATVVASTVCPSGSYTAARVTTPPTHGTLNGFDDPTGSFTYSATAQPASPAKDMDSFVFQLTCAETGARVCTGTAHVSLSAAESDETVYYLHDNLITCKGSCTTGPSARQDGRTSGTLDFDFTETGHLVIRAYTSISNLQAQYVTFTPIEAAAAPLTAAVAPRGSHVSFEPSCLNGQISYGAASNVLSWSNPEATLVSQMKDAHLNPLTDNYRLGENYFQKFGGKHQHCDIFRENPCKYAPLMTPTVTDDNNNEQDTTTAPIEWKLFVNGCDATWVAETSVESLRALRQSNGDATFQLISDSRLKGTVYLQTIAPANLQNAASGFVTSAVAYDLLVSIKNTVVVDVAVVAPPEKPSATDIDIVSDIQFAMGVDRNSNERVYAYSILLFPSRLINGIRHAVNTSTDVRVKSVYLDFFAFTSPNTIECPECTGTKLQCQGTGFTYTTDCGTDGIVSFGVIDEESMEYDHAEESPGGVNLFPSTSLGKESNLYNMSFAIRVDGTDSAKSAYAFPVGNFAIVASFSNGQEFRLTVDQGTYISEINSKFLHSRMCRSSAYWPIADPIGTSVAVAPFRVASLSGLVYDDDGNLVHEAENAPAEATYETPKALSSATVCAQLAAEAVPAYTLITSLTAIVNNTVSMCAVEEERTYGVTDWFMLSFPSIHEETQKQHEAAQEQVIQDSTLSDDAYTTATLQYLVLSIDASEAISVDTPESAATMLNILLDGSNPPTRELSEEDRWMQVNSPSSEHIKYYNWAEYATFLNFRRIHYEHHLNTADNSSITVDPFNFALVPGALLHSSSSLRVPVHITLAIRFTTHAYPAGVTHGTPSQMVVVKEHEEKLFYVISVSRSISSAMRFDTDEYSPKLVTIKTSGLGQKTATAFFIILLIAVAIVLAVCIFIEIKYKRIIHDAKYHPKRPDSAVAVRYGRNGQPLPSNTPESVASSHPGVDGSPTAAFKAMASAAAATIKSKFGLIGVEQQRIKDTGDDVESNTQSTTASAAGTPLDPSVVPSNAVIEKPPIGDEQDRASDNEVASQI